MGRLVADGATRATNRAVSRPVAERLALDSAIYMDQRSLGELEVGDLSMSNLIQLSATKLIRFVESFISKLKRTPQ